MFQDVFKYPIFGLKILFVWPLDDSSPFQHYLHFIVRMFFNVVVSVCSGVFAYVLAQEDFANISDGVIMGAVVAVYWTQNVLALWCFMFFTCAKLERIIEVGLC